MKWPNQPCPPKSWWALFRKYLRLTFCTRTQQNQSAERGMDLDRHLGRWFEVPRHTWFGCYKTKEGIIYREGEGDQLQHFRSIGAGFYSYEKEINELPVASFPISARRVDQKLWSHKKYSATTGPGKQPSGDPKPGHVVHDTLSHLNPRLQVGCSDGSSYLEDEVSGAAWLVTDGTPDHMMQAVFLMTNVNDASSYRTELEGVFRLLKYMQYANMRPDELRQWCDNKESVESCNTKPTYPSAMIQPAADLVLAIHHVKEQLGFPVTCKHVYGHQDDKKKRERIKKKKEQRKKKKRQFGDPGPKTFDGLSHEMKLKFGLDKAEKEEDDRGRTEEEITGQESDDDEGKKDEALMNQACDLHAGETTAAILDGGSPPGALLLDLPYEGSKAMLKIKGKWISTKYKETIQRAHQREAMKKYCQKRYNWSDEIFASIDNKAIGRARKGFKHSWKVRTSKLMHGWLPVNHVRARITGIAHCPGCCCKDETIEHMYKCPNERMVETKQSALKQARKLIASTGVPRHITDAVMELAAEGLQCKQSISIPDYDEATREALRQQRKVGVHLYSCEGL